MTRIKLCGMMQPKDIIAASELGADYVGFILTEGFRRSVSLETFLQLYKILDSRCKAVGVFVDEALEKIAEKYADKLDVIQLHGREDNEYIARLRELTGKPIIKAFKVTSEADIKLANKSDADYVLLDSGTGTGKVFDHSLIKGIDREFFLAGGLTAENVGEAIRALRPYAVDASSCLETDGRKDKNKMAEFVSAVRKEG